MRVFVRHGHPTRQHYLFARDHAGGAARHLTAHKAHIHQVTGWLVGLGQALGGSGACRSRVGSAFGEGESWGARRRRSRWGPFGPFGRRARASRVTERLVRAYEALGARGASRSRVRGSVGRGRRGSGGVPEGSRRGVDVRGSMGGPEGGGRRDLGVSSTKVGVGKSEVWDF